MKYNHKNIIWQPHGMNTCEHIMEIEIPDNLIFLESKHTGEYITVDKNYQNSLLIKGKPCYQTDNDWYKPDWFYDEFYGYNNIKLNGLVMNRRNGGVTLGKVLKKIKKIEYLFPEGSEINLINNRYIKLSDRTESLELKYKTTRKFKGFKEDIFKITKPSLLDNFEKDKLLAKLIIFLRENGFLFFINDEGNSYVQYGDQPDCKTAYGCGHDLVIGISEFNNHYNGYTYGKKSILADLDGYFNKWSQCFELPKPTSEEDFPKILEQLLSVKNNYSDDKDHLLND